MKKINMLVIASSFAFSSLASAAVIDFESVAVNSYSSFTTGGITFSLSAGNITVSNDGNGQYVLATTGTHFLDNRSGGSNFIFDLAAPVNYFGLQIGATNSLQTLSAFDSSSNLLGSVGIPNQVDTQLFPYTGFYVLNYSGINKVTLTGANSDWVVVDNVTTAPVPEPETYAMMLAGLGLMGFVSRRRKEDQA